MESISTSGSTLKRSSSSVAPTQNQKMTCLVDGCKSDLGKYREYYRRHRVCEHHSKVPIVIIAGQHRRFCQQCSRFHDVGEFDDEKRSCRKRLDGHNRRRRKFRPKSFYTSPGSKILHFSDPHMYETTATIYNCYAPNPSACINPGDNREISALLSTDDNEWIGQVAPVVSVCRRLADALSSSSEGNGISRSIDYSCRARSLLSPLISIQSSSVAPASSNISIPPSLIPIPDENQPISAAGSGNVILQAWPDGLLDDQPGLDYI